MGQFKIVENYEMSGSQSDHDRAYSSLEVAREVHQLANRHFEWLLKNGATWPEVEEAAEGLGREIGFALLGEGSAAREAKAIAPPNMIHKYMTPGGKIRKS